jgi:hypothetical protein
MAGQCPGHFALSGLTDSRGHVPRALPGAIALRTFGAKK